MEFYYIYFDGVQVLMFYLIIVDYFCDYLNKILICKRKDELILKLIYWDYQKNIIQVLNI